VTWGRFWRWLVARKGPLDPPPRDPVFAQETTYLERNIEQVERVNRFLLDKAVARGLISLEAAEAIALTRPGNPQRSDREFLEQHRDRLAQTTPDGSDLQPPDDPGPGVDPDRAGGRGG
jgi:hypothetical protein